MPYKDKLKQKEYQRQYERRYQNEKARRELVRNRILPYYDSDDSECFDSTSSGD